MGDQNNPDIRYPRQGRYNNHPDEFSTRDNRPLKVRILQRFRQENQENQDQLILPVHPHPVGQFDEPQVQALGDQPDVDQPNQPPFQALNPPPAPWLIPAPYQVPAVQPLSNDYLMMNLPWVQVQGAHVNQFYQQQLQPLVQPLLRYNLYRHLDPQKFVLQPVLPPFQEIGARPFEVPVEQRPSIGQQSPVLGALPPPTNRLEGASCRDLVLIHHQSASFNNRWTPTESVDNRWTPTELVDNRAVHFWKTGTVFLDTSSLRRVKIYDFDSGPLHSVLQFLATSTSILELQIGGLRSSQPKCLDDSYSFPSLQTLSIDAPLRTDKQKVEALCTFIAPKLKDLFLGELLDQLDCAE